MSSQIKTYLSRNCVFIKVANEHGFVEDVPVTFSLNQEFEGSIYFKCKFSGTVSVNLPSQSIAIAAKFDANRFFKAARCASREECYSALDNVNSFGILPWIWAGWLNPRDFFTIEITSDDFNSLKRRIAPNMDNPDEGTIDVRAMDTLYHVVAHMWEQLAVNTFKPNPYNVIEGYNVLTKEHGFYFTWAHNQLITRFPITTRPGSIHEIFINACDNYHTQNGRFY